VGALIGPMQVLGRVLEFVFLGQVRPSRLGALTLWLLPASLAVLLLAEGASPWIALFALLYGAGNGMMTIVRGALPAELYGREQYGAINGALATPVLLSKAAGPVLAAWLLGWLAPLPLIGVLAALGAIAALLFAQAIASHRSS
jgi:MFS family permease